MFEFLNFHLDDGVQDVTLVDNTNDTLGFNNSAAQVLRNSPRSDDAYVIDEDVTGEYFVLSEFFIQEVQDELSQYSFLDESTITTVEELMELISFKKEQQSSWDNMIAEINSNYQKIMKWVKQWYSWFTKTLFEDWTLFFSHLDEKGFVKTNDDGLYSISKRSSDLANEILNSLMRKFHNRYGDMDNDYNFYKS